MKLLSTEISGQTVQLTYTDGPEPKDAGQSLIVRWPNQDILKRSLIWHQMNVLNQVREWLDVEIRRLRDQLERI